jgi:hypothetical protein
MDLTQLVQQYLPNDRKTTSNGFSINCPMCVSMGERRPDTKHRGGFRINPDSGWTYHCFNCGHKNMWKSGGPIGKNLMYFLTTIGIPAKQIPIKLRLLRPSEQMTVKIEEDAPLDVAIGFDEVSLPPGSRSFESWAEDDDPPSLFFDAFNYMAGRGEAVFNGATYYWTPDTNYGINQRVIIPFYYQGKMVGYTARVFTGNTKLRKYYSNQPSDYMYNQELLEGDREIVFLIEGILDAVSIKGVGVLGNNLSAKQINLLKWSNKRIILVPDRNKAGERLLNQVIKLGWEAAVITTEWGSNVDDCAKATSRFGKLYVLETILNTATKNKIKVESGIFRLNA